MELSKYIRQINCFTKITRFQKKMILQNSLKVFGFQKEQII